MRAEGGLERAKSKAKTTKTYPPLGTPYKGCKEQHAVGAEGGKEKPDRGAEGASAPEGAIADIGQIWARVPIGIGSFRSRPPALSRGLAVHTCRHTLHPLDTDEPRPPKRRTSPTSSRGRPNRRSHPLQGAERCSGPQDTFVPATASILHRGIMHDAYQEQAVHLTPDRTARSLLRILGMADGRDIHAMLPRHPPPCGIAG